ncbi:hypothetical protein M9H77_01326 [Catharanthus roseus]|uniref:Uncharacterized protein n=1 Tax=Catharanthus roseus TaxID=4058 RepID=A0ACC0C5I9_CATRO|nr:hypothetical protein M9H77_01326 [Catharanthus roseus]
MKTNKNNKLKSITKYLFHEIFFLHRLLLRLEHSEQYRKFTTENCNEEVSKKGKKNKSREAYLPPQRPIQRRVASAWSTSSSGEPRRGASERNKAAAVKADNGDTGQVPQEWGTSLSRRRQSLFLPHLSALSHSSSTRTAGRAKRSR